MRRILAVVCLATTALVATATTAFAWGNGLPRDTYGTHDWILERAIELAGEDASWVDTTTALLATDDPDTWRTDFPDKSPAERIEAARHLFMPESSNQGAPTSAADHYALMLDALSANDTATASTELGILSHYYSDVSSPFHTCSYGAGSLQDGADHTLYELIVSQATTSSDANRDWITTATPRPVSDIRARAIESAGYTGTKLLGIIAAYGDFSGYDPDTDLTTQLLLSRAANDLADVIRAAKTGAGKPRPIATLYAWTDYEYPALERPAKVWARVVDDQGRAVRGARVEFDFMLPQRCTYDEFTEADGAEFQVHSRVLGANDVPFNVIVRAESMGTTLTQTLTLTPKPVIGPSGLRTYTKYDTSPAQGTTATVMTDVRSASGAPLANIKVVHTVRYRERTVRATTVTNAAGHAWWSGNVGSAKAGHRVSVQAHAYGGTLPENKYSGLRTASSSFVPHSEVARFSATRLTPAKPAQGTTVTVSARCLDDHGKPIVGRTVAFYFKHKTGTLKRTTKTGQDGRAKVTRNIGKSPVGYKVEVVARVRSAGKLKRDVVSFTPVKP